MLTCTRVCYLNDAQNDLSLRPGPGDSNVSRCTGEKLLLCIASLGCVHFWEMKRDSVDINKQPPRLREL